MENRFQELLATVKNDLNAKIDDMKTRMDGKDNLIKDLKGQMGFIKSRLDEMNDMKSRLSKSRRRHFFVENCRTRRIG